MSAISISSLGLDLNSTSTVSNIIELGSLRSVGVHVVSVSGTHTTHVLTLQLSPDGGANWVDTTTTVTGSGKYVSSNTCFATHARVKCSTAQGAAAVCDVYIFASDNE